MLEAYSDITSTITRLLRDYHNAIGNCPTSSDRSCSCVVEPKWHDENGVPRYDDHHPMLCPDVYAHEIALLRIACQSCAREFLVQMSYGAMDIAHAAMARRAAGVDNADQIITLSDMARDGSIHYGDPPRHDVGPDGNQCLAGDTMNVDDLAVVEFWINNADTDHEWVRVPELEREIPAPPEET